MSSTKPTVLIAEDNPGLARVLSFRFESLGFMTVTCLDGGQAWQAFNEQPIAAVVSDHEMPVMTGVKLIQRIKKVDPAVPCFLVTGRQLELSQDPTVIELGVCEVFGKPFSPMTLMNKLIRGHKHESIEVRMLRIDHGSVVRATGLFRREGTGEQNRMSI